MFLLNPSRFAGIGAGISVGAAYLADAPALYFPHADAIAATIMENEVGAPGAYVNAPTPGNPAIYTGGPSTLRTEPSNKHGSYSGTSLPSLPSISIVTIVRFNVLSGFKGIISRDEGSGTRFFQWRTNGAAMEFVNVPVGQKFAASGVFTAGVTVMIAITISAAGAIKMYKNGVEVFSGTTGASFNWGAAGNALQIGFMLGGFAADAYFSETADFPTVISPTRLADYAAAAGL